MTRDNVIAHAGDLLRKFYGYREFRPGQAEVIGAVCNGRDAMVIMPTGGGKSLCYQLPALMLDGCALVISPLIALMEDQTMALVANGIPAAAIHSGKDEALNRDAVEAALAGRIKLIYISPERLLADMDGWIGRLKISLVAVDEAHCISQWGHDFRPVYTQLQVLKERFPGAPLMALTATADRVTRTDMAAQLGLADPLVWIGSFDRPNLSLDVRQGVPKREKIATVQTLVRQYPNDSGIVYTLSRSGAEETDEALRRLGIRSCCYHAGMPSQARADAQRRFSDGDVQVVCATVAFGMGIDKSNIRWVVHFNLPGNIESYYQEIGRAGRDGLPARTVLFHSMQDLILRKRFLEDSGRPEVAAEKLEWMRRYAESGICRRRVLLSYFGQTLEHDCGNCDLCRRPPERFDGTVLFQKAASAIIRTDSQVGVRALVDILRGNAPAEIRQHGYDRIKTFGAGRDLGVREWNVYIAQMVQLGLLEVAMDNGNRLRVTDYGMRALRGLVPVQLARYVPDEDRKTRGRKKSEERIVSTDPTEQLFEQLKAVRRQVAAKSGVPAFVVFSDASLLDMARRRPKTIEEFLQVSGVGEHKSVRYGKHFIAAIRKFEGLTATMPQGTTYKETLVLHNAGVPLGEIASIKGISTETVLSHIARLVDEDMISNFAGYISRRDFDLITRTLASDPEGAWETLKEEGFSGGMIRLAQSIQRYHRRHG